MALQAPERRNTTLEQDIQHALSLSQADKRLGEYFPPPAHTSSDWHYAIEGSTGGTGIYGGGGFDPDAFAYHDRARVAREVEISVVQWARERDLQGKRWNDEEREKKGKVVMEDIDVEDGVRIQDAAWIREQRARMEELVPRGKGKGGHPVLQSFLCCQQRYSCTLSRQNDRSSI